MVGDHAVRGHVNQALRVTLPGNELGLVQKWFQKVGFVVAFNTLDNGNYTFKTHARVHMFFRQG